MDTRAAPHDLGLDQRVILHGVGWEGYEAVLALRGESSAPRLTYLRGELEIMSPSMPHERLKKVIARLLELWAFERGVVLEGVGSWTIRRELTACGVEPDECYIVGVHPQVERPDIAIEVIWTHGGLDKLEVYRGLGVPEVWMWRDGRIEVWELGDREQGYARREGSAVLPDLDLALLEQFIDPDHQTEAVRRYRSALHRL